MSGLRVNYQDARDYATRQTSPGPIVAQLHSTESTGRSPLAHDSTRRQPVLVRIRRFGAASPSEPCYHAPSGLPVPGSVQLTSETPREPDLSPRSHPKTATLAVCFFFLVGCTCTPTGSFEEPAEQANQEATIEVGTAAGALAVTLVLDPSGALCTAAVTFAAGARHVVCDRSAEDLSAAALKRGLSRLKAERGAAVAPQHAWLVAAPERAAVARSLATAEPAFFSRVAVWVGDSPNTANLFGPTFLAAVGHRGLETLVLFGPGASQGEILRRQAERQGVRLRLVPAPAPAGDAGLWATLAEEFTASPPK